MKIEGMNAEDGTFPAKVMEKLVEDLGYNVIQFLGSNNKRMFVVVLEEEDLEANEAEIPQEWRRESKFLAIGAWRVGSAIEAQVHATHQSQRCDAAAVELTHYIRQEISFWAENVSVLRTVTTRW
jgi:hypothetical protein